MDHISLPTYNVFYINIQLKVRKQTLICQNQSILTELTNIDRVFVYIVSIFFFFLILVFLNMEGSDNITTYFDYQNDYFYSISQANQAHIR